MSHPKDLPLGVRAIAISSIVVALAGCAAGGPTIPSLDIAITGRTGDRVGYVFRKPEGPGPFPAVVLMHGCAGWHGGNISAWSDWFAGQGYAALAIDSFGPRAVDNICVTRGAESVTVTQRIGDAYGALAWLRSRADIDGERVVLMGFSHGGMTVVEAMSRGTIGFLGEIGQLRFRAGIALYPHCQLAAPLFYAPVTIISGSADDWTPAEECVNWLKQHSYVDSPLAVHVIPAATHAFDMPTWRGQAVGSRKYLQYHLVYDQSAVEKAHAIVQMSLRLQGLQ